MKLSILLVCYNQENYIHKAVNSIMLQDIPFEHEIVIADDFSNDKTLDLIKSAFKNHNKEIRVLDSQQNLGISKNYQRGFSACKGEYIAVLEGDDYWTNPQRLKKIVGFLDEKPNFVLCFNRFQHYFTKSKALTTQNWHAASDYEVFTTSTLAKANRIGNMSACVFRRAALERINPELYTMRVADWMLGMAVGEFGQIARLKDVMSVYVVHSKGVWSGRKSVDNFQRLIDHTIDAYDAFFNYKYHQEFQSNKIRCQHILKKRKSLRYKLIVRPFTELKKFIKGLMPFLKKQSQAGI